MASNSSQKVRIVGKIRAFLNKETGVIKPWISVHRSQENSAGRVRVSFGDQGPSGKNCFEVDECYEQEFRNDVIFDKEIKPLISLVFEGRDATVFAYGARESGKTYTIQGSEDEPGVAVLAMAEILSRAEEIGCLVTISLYEIHQGRVFDLLDSKRPEVSVFKDARGKIRLKGLSKVNVKSMPEFQNLYISGGNVRKSSQKIATEPLFRSHRGLIVHVLSSSNEYSSPLLLGKMNFVDLAGYEDATKKSINDSNIMEITRVNKSLYAIHNVVYALSIGESHVPYRESKLMLMLQSSLGSTNVILMVTCMNPHFCKDTVKTVSLASRLCQASHQANEGSSRRLKNASKTVLASTSKVVKSMTPSTSMKKQVGSQLCIFEHKASRVAIETKGRKLFHEANQSKKSNQEMVSFESASAIEPSFQEKENISLGSVSLIESSLQEEGCSISSTPLETEPLQTLPMKEVEENHIIPTPVSHQTPISANFPGEDVNKENRILLLDEGGSPPLSARLRELSENLKSLCTSTQSKMKNDSFTNYEGCKEILEPKTPVQKPRVGVGEKCEFAPLASPWEKFHARSSGMKDSFVQEYLKFLNTASKEELKGLKGIGEKRATYILEQREQSPEPFKSLHDLEDIGLSTKQIKGMMRKAAGDLF
ncbi:hypothetical protein Ancab_009215 [Ancistrocladus abbreviatus]